MTPGDPDSVGPGQGLCFLLWMMMIMTIDKSRRPGTVCTNVLGSPDDACGIVGSERAA